MRNRFAILVAAICLAAFLPAIASACSVFYPTVEVGKAFRVKVTDRGRPIKGLRLVLKPPDLGGGPISSVTDSDGYASFDDLFPGSLTLTAEYDGEWGDTIFIHITSDGPANETVSLTWPARNPIKVRAARGLIRGPEYYPDQAQAELSLSLIEGITAREIEETRSDNKGHFTFNSILAPGIYYVRLNPSGLRAWDNEQIQGAIPIDINETAGLDELDLDLSWSSCGLGYSEAEHQSSLKISKLCGDVKDQLGAVIGRAQVWLEPAAGESVVIEHTTTSGESGQFELKERVAGDFLLIVKSPGFQPYLRVIHLDPAKTSDGCKHPLHIRPGALF